MSGYRLLQEFIMKQVKNVDGKIWTNFQISEGKIAIFDIFLGHIVLLGCVWATAGFEVLFTFWVFKFDVPPMEKLGC